MSDTEGPELIDRWRQGDERAASKLYHRYMERLLSLASQNLPSALRVKYDEQDAANSAFKSLMLGARNNRFDFKEEEDIWKLLITIMFNKIRNRIRHATAQKRDMNRELGKEDWLLAELSSEPGPEETAEFVEVIERFEQSLKDSPELSKHVCDVFRLKLEGYSTKEIADAIKQTTRSVNRHVERIRRRLEEFLAAQIPTDSKSLQE